MEEGRGMDSREACTSAPVPLQPGGLFAAHMTHKTETLAMHDLLCCCGPFYESSFAFL